VAAVWSSVDDVDAMVRIVEEEEAAAGRRAQLLPLEEAVDANVRRTAKADAK
jgi:hypothetical protein